MAGRSDGQLLPGAIQPAPAGGRPGGPLLEHLHVLEVQFIRTSINYVQCGMSANFSHETIMKCQKATMHHVQIPRNLYNETAFVVVEGRKPFNGPRLSITVSVRKSYTYAVMNGDDEGANYPISMMHKKVTETFAPRDSRYYW